MKFYNIPLRVDQIMKGHHKDDDVDIRESIHQNIQLILKSFTLSYQFDPTFGSIMNKYHAHTPPQNQSERIWRENMRESIQENLKDMIQRYETRIKLKDLIVFMESSKKKSGTPFVKVKVQLSGEFTLGRKEKFQFPDSEVEDSAQGVFPLMIPVGNVKN